MRRRFDHANVPFAYWDAPLDLPQQAAGQESAFLGRCDPRAVIAAASVSSSRPKPRNIPGLIRPECSGNDS